MSYADVFLSVVGKSNNKNVFFLANIRQSKVTLFKREENSWLWIWAMNQDVSIAALSPLTVHPLRFSLRPIAAMFIMAFDPFIRDDSAGEGDFSCEDRAGHNLN